MEVSALPYWIVMGAASILSPNASIDGGTSVLSAPVSKINVELVLERSESQAPLDLLLLATKDLEEEGGEESESSSSR